MPTKFSIIIPTLWKSGRIYKLIDELDACPEVDEIILIDNAGEYDQQITKPYNKIHVVSVPRNIFVNPAWNLGVKMAKNSNIGILNDDINFNTAHVFDFVAQHIDKGIIGQCCSNYDPIDRGLPMEIEKIKSRPSGWGCMLFIKKENYLPIPEELLIACGDDYLFERVKGGAYIMKNLRVDTRISTTSILPQFFKIQEEDILKYKQLKND